MTDVANATVLGNMLGSRTEPVTQAGSTAASVVGNAPSSLEVAEDSAPATLGISAGNGAQLTITVTGLPSNGLITTHDGASVRVGDALTSDELSALQFTPARGVFGQTSTFTYDVADAAGNACTAQAKLSIGPAAASPITPSVDTDPVTGVALPSIDPNLNGAFAVTNVDGGRSGGNDGSAYTGPMDYLQREFIWTGTQGIAARADVPNAFLHGGSGNDALQVTSGRNVLDGGSGSNFLVGSDGADGNSDIFFLDERTGAATWSTLVNFHAGDEATIWGFRQGTSTMSWSDAAGSAGYKGATMSFETEGAERVRTRL